MDNIINKESFSFNDPGGRFHEVMDLLEALSRRKKLAISTQDVDGKPVSILAKVTDLTYDPLENHPSTYAAHLKADYRINRQGFVAAVDKTINVFMGMKLRARKDDFLCALMNNGSIEGITKEQFDDLSFDFSDLKQRFL